MANNITDVYAIGTRGSVEGLEFHAKRCRNGKYELINKKYAQDNKIPHNYRSAIVYVDSLDKAKTLIENYGFGIRLHNSKSNQRNIRYLKAIHFVT